MVQRKVVPANDAGVGEVVDFVEDFLRAYGLKERDLIQALLKTEESLGSLVKRARPGSEVHVNAKALLGTVTIELSCEGEEYGLTETVDMTDSFGDGTTDGVEDMIRDIMLSSFADDLQYSHKRGVNHIRVSVVRSKRKFLYQTLGAMALGVVAGLLMSSFAPEGFTTLLDENVLGPIDTMYMNALKMIVAPVVFFSIVSCIARFGNLSELGRVGLRILALFLVTTCAAIAVGIGSFWLFRPGRLMAAGQALADASSITSQTIDVSLIDRIVEVVPSNVLQPFIESNMLQLIFLAVICGVATGMIGTYSEVVKSIFEGFNDLFLKITHLIIKVMPVAVFCASCSTMLSTGVDSIRSVLGIFGTFVFGLAAMMVLYCLMLLVARINPVPFLKKYAPTMLQVFSVASSNASIPINLGACDRLGVAKKVYSLSIPLGATLNKDGTCIHLAVFSLALAHAYGVQVTDASLVGVVVAIVVLSIGAGIPGSGLICLSVLLSQMNVPVEAIGLVMGIDSLAGMLRTVGNCLGDVVVTLLVAKREGALDSEIYHG